MEDATIGSFDIGGTDAELSPDMSGATDILIDDPDRGLPPDGTICPACPGLQTCDPMTGECVEAETCEVDRNCLNERICEEDRCIDGCTVTGCANDLICDSDRRCTEASPCMDDNGCSPGRVCRRNQFSNPCTMDADCEGQRTCDINTGRCQEPTECAENIDCDQGRVCVERVCASGCTEIQPCPGRQECVDGSCNEPV